MGQTPMIADRFGGLSRFCSWSLLVLALLPCRDELMANEELHWRELPALPDRQGFAGSFVGTHQDALIVAGGANFPDKKPWEGGTKVWTDAVFVLDESAGEWKIAGRLPRPLGYGVSLSTKNGIVCMGGSDAQQHYSEVFRLSLESGQLRTMALPSLPMPCANFSGALLGNTILVAGGIDSPSSTSALKTFWSLDLDSDQPQWQVLEAWPGPARMLAVTAVRDNSFFLASGTDLTSDAEGKPFRHYLKDAYRYRAGEGWIRIADLPRPTVAAPFPAPAFGASTFLVLGGDDGSLVNFQPPEKHPGFPKGILAYDTLNDRWSSIGEMPAAHVTTTMTSWKRRFVMPSGEVRPGVRSPAVWAFEIQ